MQLESSGAIVLESCPSSSADIKLADVSWSEINWHRHLPLGLHLTQDTHTNLLSVFFRYAIAAGTC